jgi:2-phosphosulfolactate phosphatase
MIIDVALTPADIALLPKGDLTQTTCIVFDILRATSSMITAIAHGAREIHPVQTLEEAFALREELGGGLLAGERHGDKPARFDFGNSPLEFRTCRGAHIIWTTTNGTVALRACEAAGKVLVGSLLNMQALVDDLEWDDPERVLLVCAGTFEEFALEDATAAGRLIAEFPKAELTDAAYAALSVAQRYPRPIDALRAARNGKALAAKGREKEVEWCAQLSVYNVGACMDGVIVRPIE